MPDGQPRSIDWSALRVQLRGVAIAAVVVFNIPDAYAIASGDWDDAGIVWLLLNTEGNPATWFSSIVLLTAGVCAIGCGLIGPREHQRFWSLVGALLVAMSVEEVAQFHELLSGNIDDASGVAAAWVIPGGILVIVALVVLVRAAPPLDRWLVAMLAGGTALFVIGALGFELLSTEIYPEQDNDPRRNLIIATFEENLELAGGMVLAWATSGRLLEDSASRAERRSMREDLWETHAHWWQDGFTGGADPEYEEQILPLAAVHLDGTRCVLDVGCGEGQVTRLAATLGAAAVGIDPTAAQVVEAAKRGGAVGYTRAEAGQLPFPPGSFDAVVACLVFEHIVEVDTAIAEVARVLEPGGRFLFFLNHPLLQTPNSGWIDDQILDPPEQYWRIGPYLVEDETIEEVEKGVFIPFIHRPLSRYVNALAEAGLMLSRMDEPAPPPGFLARAHEYQAAATIPRLLFLRCEKQGHSA